MGLVGAVAVLLRRIRAERGVAVLLFVLVAVTSLVVAASPRLFDRVADAGLRYELDRATSAQRNLQFTTVDQISAGERGDVFDRVESRGETLLERLPESVHRLVEARRYVVDLTRFRLTDPPNYPTYLTLRYQDGIDEHITMTDGRRPARLELPADPDEVPRFEVAISAATAAETLVEVGDTLPVAVDPGDPMLRNVFPRPTDPYELEVVGLFQVDDPDAPYWFDESVLARAAVAGTVDAPIAFATGLFAPEAYPDLLTMGLPLRYRWRFGVDAQRIDAGQVTQLRPDLRRLETTFGTTGAGAGRLLYRSGLLDIVERFVTRRAATEATLWVAAMGPLAVAGGALGLVAVIVVGRRRLTLALARGRGASAGQLLTAQLWEGLLITVPASLVGLVVAGALVPGRSTSVSAIGALLVALAVTALLLAATWPPARRARRELERGESPIQRISPRRTVFEATVIGVAVAAVWLLRERGLGAQRPASGADGFDPFLAAAPVLVGVATGLLAIRLYPIPVRALAWMTARRPDLVPALGLRTIGRNPRAAYLPLLVLTLTIAIGVFSSVLAVTIERGQVAASWRDVGADYRIEAASGGPVRAGDLGGAPGVEAVAAGVIATTTAAVGEVGRQASTTLIAVEPAAYEAVLAGSPVALRLPAALTAASLDAENGPGDQPIPAIVSRRLPNGWRPVAIGEVFRVGVGEQPVTFMVVDLINEFPGVRRGSTFIVAPLAPVVAARDGPALRPSVLFVRGPADIGPSLRAAAGEPAVVQLTSRHERLATERAAPLVAAVGQGFGVALAAAAAYALLAVVAVVALEAQRRARELAYLRTLGLSEGQAFALTVVEQAPPVLLALAVGVGLGLGLAWLLEPGLGLAAFIAPGAPVLLEIDWVTVTAVGVSVVIVVGLLVVTSAWLARRLEPGRALRMGE